MPGNARAPHRSFRSRGWLRLPHWPRANAVGTSSARRSQRKSRLSVEPAEIRRAHREGYGCAHLRGIEAGGLGAKQLALELELEVSLRAERFDGSDACRALRGFGISRVAAEPHVFWAKAQGHVARR